MMIATRRGIKRPIAGPGFVLLQHVPSSPEFFRSALEAQGAAFSDERFQAILRSWIDGGNMARVTHGPGARKP